MKNFHFWQMWLLIVGLGLCGLGLLLAFTSDSSLMDFVFNDRIDPVFWGDGAVPEEGLLFRGWVYGVLGSVIVGWGILIAFIAHFPFKRKERWAWNCVFLAVWLWYIPDTIISAYSGVGFNVVFNTGLLVLVMLPLVFTRHQFRQPTGAAQQ